MKMKKLIAVIGTTGVGKSKLAIELAKRFNGEVINADAMQMYSCLDIATNKVSKERMEGIPHHMLGIYPPTTEITVIDFVREALAKIKEITDRGKLPIVVGGTHYYVQSLLWETQTLGKECENDELNKKNAFEEITKAIEREEKSEMHRLLKRVDPVMAERWHPNDTRKVIRSLKFFIENNGQKYSDYLTNQNHRSRFDSLLFCLNCDFSILDPHLDTRVDEMFQMGLLEELQNTFNSIKHAEDIDYTRGIYQTIGFKEFDAFLRGKCSDYKAAVEEMKCSTRQYARKQVRWVRNQIVPIMQKSNCLERLFVFDTKIFDWEVAVLNPSVDLAEAFVSDSSLPNPLEVCPKQNEFMEVLGKIANKNILEWKKFECEYCKVILNGPHEERQHLQSRKHKKQVDRATKPSRKEIYEMQLKKKLKCDE